MLRWVTAPGQLVYEGAVEFPSLQLVVMSCSFLIESAHTSYASWFVPWEKPGQLQLLWGMSFLYSWGWFCSLAEPGTLSSAFRQREQGAGSTSAVLFWLGKLSPVQGSVSRQACTLGAFLSMFAAAAGSGIDQLGTCLVLTGLRPTWSACCNWLL